MNTMPSLCRSLREDLKAHLDGELPLPRRMAVSAHLSRCAACQKEMQEMKRIGRNIRESESHLHDARALSPEFRARLLEHLDPILPVSAVGEARPAPYWRQQPLLVFGSGAVAVMVFTAVFLPLFRENQEGNTLAAIAEKVTNKSAAEQDGVVPIRIVPPPAAAPAAPAASNPPADASKAFGINEKEAAKTRSTSSPATAVGAPALVAPPAITASGDHLRTSQMAKSAAQSQLHPREQQMALATPSQTQDKQGQERKTQEQKANDAPTGQAALGTPLTSQQGVARYSSQEAERNSPMKRNDAQASGRVAEAAPTNGFGGAPQGRGGPGGGNAMGGFRGGASLDNAQAPAAPPASPPAAGAAPKSAVPSAPPRAIGTARLVFPPQNVPEPNGAMAFYAANQAAQTQKASIAVAVEKVESAYERVEELVKTSNGYVAQSNLSTDKDGSKAASLTVKVPQMQFDEVLASVGRMGDVVSKSVSTDDLAAQISNALRDERTIAEQMKKNQQKLKDEVLIAGDRETMEQRQLRGQLQKDRSRLDMVRKRSALCTITISLTEKGKRATSSVPQTTGFLTGLGGTYRSAATAFCSAVQVPIVLLLWALAFSPLWLPLLLAYRWAARRNLAQQLSSYRGACNHFA
jgi:anti-sigma factor RsiW